MLDLDDFRFCVFEQLALEFSEGEMHLRLVCDEMQNAAHLRFRVAARSGIGHGQTSRNTEWGKEKIARPAFEMSVKIKGEGGVAFNKRFGLGRRMPGSRTEAERPIYTNSHIKSEQ